jgi:hypothetical protein
VNRLQNEKKEMNAMKKCSVQGLLIVQRSNDIRGIVLRTSFIEVPLLLANNVSEKRENIKWQLPIQLHLGEQCRM